MTKELILYQESQIASRERVAERLRELADNIEDMTFAMGEHEISLPESVSFKMEADLEKQDGQDVTELEFEIRWQPWNEMPEIAKGLVGN
ncbi:MAG: amphi-Trp domain-containing protein [Aridibacter sp.]